jgi:hypothetical protein
VHRRRVPASVTMRLIVRLVDIRWGHGQDGIDRTVGSYRGNSSVRRVRRVTGALAMLAVHGEGTDQQSQHYGDSHERSMHQ